MNMTFTPGEGRINNPKHGVSTGLGELIIWTTTHNTNIKFDFRTARGTNIGVWFDIPVARMDEMISLLQNAKAENERLNNPPKFPFDPAHPLRCPCCGEDATKYTEDIQNSRDIDSVDADDQTVNIQGYYKTDDLDDGDNPSFFCEACDHSWPVPADVTTNFL